MGALTAFLGDREKECPLQRRCGEKGRRKFSWKRKGKKHEMWHYSSGRKRNQGLE